MEIRDKILIVEDDVTVARYIQAILESNGFEVIPAKTGRDALSLICSHCPDLILLDLGLPDLDGMKIIESTRRWSQIPIIVVSARTHERDKVEALYKGADDYITKPFGAAELLARVRVSLRHFRDHNYTEKKEDNGVRTIGNLSIDYDRHQVLINGENTHLTQNEYKILVLLAQNLGKVMTYDSIQQRVWGPMCRGNNQILRVNMANIRRKIEKNPADPEYIFTEVGVGYRMEEP